MSDDSIPTHHPKFDVHDPIFQEHRDRIERERCPDPAANEAFYRLVTEAYRAASQSKLIQTAMLAMLKLYGTQQSVADILGIDRSCISVAKDYGDLGSGPLADMFSNWRVLQMLTEHSDGILRNMGRHGFIAASRHAYALWYGLEPTQVELSIVKYEELCQTLSTGLAKSGIDPHWRDVFVYVFATIEGFDGSIFW
jgi:hypothetical protein